MIITQGMSTADVQQAIQAATGYWLGAETWQGWGGETDRLNLIAADFDLDALAHGDAGADARAKINAIIAAFDLPADAAFYGDLLAGRYYRTAQPSCVRASPAYAPDLAGVYQAFGNDELRLTDAGLYVPEPMRTNKCTNYNANPTDNTNMSQFGDPAAIFTFEDDTAALEAAGLANLCTSGVVCKLDNSAGTGNAGVNITGGTGNTNPHTVSAYIRGSSGVIAGETSSDGSSAYPASEAYVRRMVTIAPSGSKRASVRVDAGGTIYFILNQLEEASTASSPIITAGSAATRAADTVTPPIPSGTYDLHLLIDDATEEVIEGFQDGDALPLDLPQGKNIVKYWGVEA